MLRHTDRRSTAAGRACGPHGAGHPEGEAHCGVRRRRKGGPVGPVDIIGRQECRRRRPRSAPGGRRLGGRRYWSPRPTVGGPARRWTPPESFTTERTPRTRLGGALLVVASGRQLPCTVVGPPPLQSPSGGAHVEPARTVIQQRPPAVGDGRGDRSGLEPAAETTRSRSFKAQSKAKSAW